VEKVERLHRGEMPIYEAGLEELVREGVAAGRLSFVVGASAAVPEAEFVFLCVQTPQGDDGGADMTFIQAAAREIGPHLSPGTVVINKSTVPVGSTRVVERALGRDDVAVVSNPEFLREGTAVYDCLNPDRIVIGTDDRDAALRVEGLFEGLDTPVIITDPASAETIKYAANAFLATKVSFVNAIANLCEAVGADANDVVQGLGYDHRIGFEFLKPGPGWGGSCLPKDTRALIRIGDDAGYDFSLLRGVVAVNEDQFDRVVAKVVRLARGALNGRVIAVWGLAFKARTDDIRFSPALEVIRRLHGRGAVVRAFDPAATGEVPEVERCDDAYTACEGAHVLVVLTEWDEFRGLDLDKVKAAMASPAIVDARNLLDADAARRKGFTYEGIGRP
ncbi:MAG: UDP-glucose dehydrogenase family protein, partial [Acidimicrobiales bacterium]